VLCCGLGNRCLRIEEATVVVQPGQLEINVIPASIARDVKCVMLRWPRTASKPPTRGLWTSGLAVFCHEQCMTGVDTQGPIAFIYAHWAFKFQVSSLPDIAIPRSASGHTCLLSQGSARHACAHWMTGGADESVQEGGAKPKVLSLRAVQQRAARVTVRQVHAALRESLWWPSRLGGCCASSIRQRVSVEGCAARLSTA